MNWKTILSTIREDPKKFWEDGGWNFLNADGSDDDASESEEEDAYNPSDQSDEEVRSSYGPSRACGACCGVCGILNPSSRTTHTRLWNRNRTRTRVARRTTT